MPDDALPRGYLDASRSMTSFLPTPFVLDRLDRSHLDITSFFLLIT